jgi:hypothetical protein
VKLQHFDIEFRRPAGATNVLCKKHPVWALSAKVGMLYPFYRNIAMNLQTSQCSAFKISNSGQSPPCSVPDMESNGIITPYYTRLCLLSAMMNVCQVFTGTQILWTQQVVEY